MRVAVLLALNVALVSAQAPARPALAQAPARDRPVRSRPAEIPEPRTTQGAIRGRVVADVNAESPLVKVRVEVVAQGREMEWMFTDSTGRFDFSGLPAGQYQLLADKTGYAPTAATIGLQDGDSEDIEIRMSKGAVIAGRIVDALGEPLVGGRVLISTILVEGRERRVEPASRTPADTDDLGSFRIGGLPAGSYLLSVSAPNRGPSVTTEFNRLTGPRIRIGSGRTFYPASSTSAGAVPIELAPGEEKLDVDLTLTPYSPALLTVSVSASPDAALRNANRQVNLSFASGESPDPETRGSRTMGLSPNPAPVTAALDPGAWTIIARRGLDGGIAHATLGPGETQSAPLTIRPAASFGGQVIFEGATRSPAAAVYLDVVGAGADGGLSPQLLAPEGPSVVKRDGTFSISGLLGTVELFVSAPPGWAVSRFAAGDRDLIREPVAFEGGETITNARIVLTDQVAQLNGVVSDAEGRPDSRCAVAVFPADAAGFNRYRMQLVQTDRAGRFAAPGLLPGVYNVTAARHVSEATWTAPENLDRLRASGTSVTLAGHEKKTLTLTCGDTR